MTEPAALTPECPTTFDLGERIHDERIRYPVLAGDWSARANEYSYEMAQEIARVVVEAGWTPPSEVDRLRAENDAWRNYGKWSCTRDNRSYPCGDCDGCRAGVWGSRATAAALQARIDAVLKLLDPASGMAVQPFANGARYFAERDLRAALTGDQP